MKLIPLAAIATIFLLSACGRGPTSVYQQYYLPRQASESQPATPQLSLAEQNQNSLQQLPSDITEKNNDETDS